eukprot:GHVQ01034169.1.p1 GENE.GHVQ01034169.1~~GHVQ01034169.1.p1  ORF type:complete len:1339 (-),score=193.81 GHVQ01034169.1:3291-7307(-)
MADSNNKVTTSSTSANTPSEPAPSSSSSSSSTSIRFDQRSSHPSSSQYPHVSISPAVQIHGDAAPTHPHQSPVSNRSSGGLLPAGTGEGEKKKSSPVSALLHLPHHNQPHLVVRQEPHATGNFGLSDFPDNLEAEVIERLSKSHASLKGLVEQAKLYDPEAFEAAKNIAEANHPTSEGKNRFAAESVAVLAKEFYLDDVNEGLTNEKVIQQRKIYGYNLLEKEVHDPAWKIFLFQFRSLIVNLLLVAAIVCLALQEWVEGVAIFVIVLLNATLATYMEKSAGNALAKLASMAAPHCLVRREGVSVSVDATELVPGDIVLLSTGDAVPADLRVFESVELKANEALLTGEPEDIKKTLEAADKDTPFATNLCFASSSITNGNGKGIVIATGMDTQVGRIAEQLKKASKGSKLTPLQKGLNRLGGLIGIVAICVLVIVVVVAVVTDYKDPAHPDKNQILTIVLVAVGFAVSSIPEGLPMVVTISLSLGARDMVKRKANVRKLPAVETLGCCSVICSDKTGTLTEGKMTAVKLVTVCRSGDPGGVAKSFSFYPTKGFDPNGGIFAEEDMTAGNQTAMINQYNRKDFQKYDSICTDYGNPANAAQSNTQLVRTLLLSGYLNSYGTRLLFNSESNLWETKGNMSEGAIVVAAAKGRWGEAVGDSTTLTDYQRLVECEVPFNSSRKMMVTVHKLPNAGVFGHIGLAKTIDTAADYSHVAIVKGAPDKVMKYVRHVLINDSVEGSKIDWGTEVTVDDIKCVDDLNLKLSQAALRVLAFTIRPLSENDVRHLISCDGADERLQYILGAGGTMGLTLLGVMGSLDPARPGVGEAIQTCRQAGVRVIMITGDQQPTACAIAKDIGLLLPNDDAAAVSIICQKLHLEDDATLDHRPADVIDEIVNRVNVFSRAQPEDKITIVDALRRQGHVVAMTGDGVNDAPALQAADIGVAMGIVGTDVAKGAAEMVLLDDNFCTIVGAIEEGRKIYANIQKFVCFLLGTNIGEIIYLTVSIAASLPLPLEALQILFLNLMSDGCPAVALSREPADEDNMLKPPRPRNQQIMTREWWVFGNLPHTIFESISVLACLCGALYMSLGVLQLDDIAAQCYKAELPVTGVEGARSFNYFCASFEYRVQPDYTGWVTNIDYWDPQANHMQQYLGVMAGRYYDLSVTTPGVPLAITEAYTQGCGPGTIPMADGRSWCMPDGLVPVDGTDGDPVGAAPLDYMTVSARGSRIARTQSFITAVWCEMLRAYTVRSWEWIWVVFNRNPWMHFACSLSATLTTLVTVVPGIMYVFSTTTLMWWQYLFAISWAVLNLILDEIIPKPLYRRIRAQNKKKKLGVQKELECLV